MELRLILSCAAGLALATQAKAATVWNQPVDSSLPGLYSELEGQQIADEFTLTEQSTITSISWAGYYDSPQALTDPVSFKVRFFSDAGVSPQVPVESPFEEYDVAANAVPTGAIVAGWLGADTPLLSYTVSLSPLTLDADTYWVSILETDARSLFFHPNEWLWSRSDFSGDFAHRGSSTPWTSNFSGNLALSLNTGNTIPIPPALWLFSSGLLGLVGVARRKKPT